MDVAPDLAPARLIASEVDLTKLIVPDREVMQDCRRHVADRRVNTCLANRRRHQATVLVAPIEGSRRPAFVGSATDPL